MKKPDEIIPTKPTDFFRFLIEKRWSYFVRLNLIDLNNNQASIVALVKAMRARNLKAIRAGMNRIDGKLAQQVEIEFPHFYMEFPQASTKGLKTVENQFHDITKKADDKPIPTTGLRNTLRTLGNANTRAVPTLLAMADEVERLALEDIYPPEKQDPFVKSVVMACLLDMGQEGDLQAVFEVLDTIDGVVADKIQLLGDDVIIQSPALTAPKGAHLSPEGVARIELPNQSKAWGEAIAMKKGLSAGGDE